MSKNAQKDVWDDFSIGSGRHHETFEGKRRLLRELSILGWLRFHNAFDQALNPDRHEGEFEIHYIVSGELNWWVEETEYLLTAGTVLVIKPGELHGSKTGALEPCEHFWLRVSVPKTSALPGLTKRQSYALIKDLHAIRSRAFPASESIRDAFARLFAEHRKHTEYSTLSSRATLHILLTAVIRDHRKHAERKTEVLPKISKRVQACLVEIQQNLENPPGVEALASFATMSETSFRKRFREEVGSSPHDYITQRRIEKSQRLLLQQDKSVIDVALELGFSSSQYFATVFKRKTGMSPKQFRVQGKISC